MQITQTRQEEGCEAVCCFCGASVLTLWVLFLSPDEKNRRWLSSSFFFLLSATFFSFLVIIKSLSLSLRLYLYAWPSAFLCLYNWSINIYNISSRRVLCFHCRPPHPPPYTPPFNFSTIQIVASHIRHQLSVLYLIGPFAYVQLIVNKCRSNAETRSVLKKRNIVFTNGDKERIEILVSSLKALHKHFAFTIEMIEREKSFLLFQNLWHLNYSFNAQSLDWSNVSNQIQ